MKKIIFLLCIITIASCSSDDDNKFYLAENGITCKCENAKVGEKGTINGIQYEAVDRNLLVKRRSDGADLTRVCTSLVTDMSQMFVNTIHFNEPIGNWDVSNVTNMDHMFAYSPFNQSIEYWDVSNVTEMNRMFAGTEFNQPIDNWDVGNVTNMTAMFADSQFNQPIGSWNVSNVENMEAMFIQSSFNQPLGNWDVRKVLVMWYMFHNSPFNQNISSWCVPDIPSEPNAFSLGAPLTPENKPVWGTCP